MNRKLKALGLALVAVFAMSALSAATASALPAHIGAEKGTILGTNVGEEEFITNAGTVKCKVSKYEGTFVTSTPATQTVKPTYEKCTAFGFIETKIDVGTCEYEFNTSSGLTSLVDIVNCKAGEPIRVTAFNCEVQVGNQTGMSHVVWSNNPERTTEHENGEKTVDLPDVHATTTISTIKYTQVSKSFPGCTNGTFTNGVYKGTNTVRAFNEAGAQVPIQAT